MKTCCYALLLLGLVSPFVRAQEVEKAKPTTVPFELLASNHMLVKASINGGEPRKFIFDLGAPMTLINGKAAEETKIVSKAPKLTLFMPMGNTKAKSFRVGDAEIRDMPVIIMDHPAVAALAEVLGEPIDGLVGYTFFAHYRTTIDYQKKEMTLAPIDFEVKDIFQSLPAQLMGPRPKTAPKVIVAPA